MTLYRYEKMLNQFKELECFERYTADDTAIKNIIFNLKKGDERYIIEIARGAFEEPRIYKVDEGKRQRVIDVVDVNLEVQQTYYKINSIMEKANEHYKELLPNYEYESDSYKIKIRNVIEVIVGKNKTSYPDEIFMYIQIFKEERLIGEVEYCFINISTKPYIPMWVLESCSYDEKLLKSVGFQIQLFIKEEAKVLLERWNKPHRVQQMFILAGKTE
jgi:hypothetical protein